MSVLLGREMEYSLTDQISIDDVFQVYQESGDFLALGPHPKTTKDMVRKDLEESLREENWFCGIVVDKKIIGII